MEEIDLKKIFDMFWSKKIAIIIIIAIFILIGFFYTKTIVKPDYKALTTLALAKNNVDNSGETITQTEVTLNQNLVATYTELIKSNNILRQVINNLNIDIQEENLRKNISVKLLPNTQLIEISVANANPEIAQKLTNEIANVFMKKISEIYNMNNINVLDEAQIPSQPYNINNMKNIMMFTIIGIIIAGAYVIVLNMFDSTISNQEEAEKKLQLTVLASIPQYDYELEKKGKK